MNRVFWLVFSVPVDVYDKVLYNDSDKKKVSFWSGLAY